MKKKKTKVKKPDMPIEPQSMNAYDDTEKLKPESKVSIPSLRGVIKTKKWVEENKK